MGTSGTLAFEAWNKFTRLGLKCFYVMDFHSQLLQASVLCDGDIAISGINKDTLSLVDVIRGAKAYSIGITNFSKTPFENSVDLCLSFFNNHLLSEGVSGLVSRIPLLLVIEAIYKTLEYELNNEKLEGSYKKIFGERSV